MKKFFNEYFKDFWKERFHGDLLFGISVLLLMAGCFDSKEDPAGSLYPVLCLCGPFATFVIAFLVDWFQGQGHKTADRTDKEWQMKLIGSAIGLCIVVPVFLLFEIGRWNLPLLISSAICFLAFIQITGVVQNYIKNKAKKKAAKEAAARKAAGLK